MATIGLKAYQDKLAGWLADGRFDEVIAHSRHILKTYSKNLRAYRQLGQALCAAARWEEAADVLQRLVGARLQDFETHSLLAQSYEQLGQPQRAIWHAQWAFELQPSNQDAIQRIRRLYRAVHGEDIAGLRLTASALAQQHIRNNLLQDALNVLDAALEKHPSRLDLQLMRARTLWLAGQRTDAAEAAIEVLAKLPYSLTANQIMAELWLAEQRPSDAQLYLSRLAELDPYLAHELGGEALSEMQLTLDELDYAPPEQPARATDDLGGLLAASELDALFDELTAADAAPAVDDDDDELAELSDSLADEFFADAPAAFAADADAPADDAPDDLDDLDAADADAPDDALAQLLESLPAEDEDGDWLMQIQQGIAEPTEPPDPDEPAAALPPETLDEIEREFFAERDSAPDEGEQWLSDALRGMIVEQEAQRDAELDLFADDEQLQNLLSRTGDTEPIHADDIEFWLNPDEGEFDEAESPAPGDSWLDEDFDDAALEDIDVPVPPPPGNDADSAALIDRWQRELGELEGQGAPDADSDWLSEAEPEVFDILAPEEPPPDPDITAPPADEDSERARAWGLQDSQELADFVEDDADDAVELAQGESSADWLNAMVPGLGGGTDDADGADGADGNDEPLTVQGAARQPDFAWLKDIVDEETGKMQAVAPPAADQAALYLRFSQAPPWLAAMRGESPANGGSDGIPATRKLSALSLDSSPLDFEFDDFDLDRFFGFDSPTEKLPALSPDDAAAETSLGSLLGADTDFDFDSPTERTAAIQLDENADQIHFDELGWDESDFDFDTPTERMAAIRTDDEVVESDFDDIGLDAPRADESSDSPPEWLEYDSFAGDSPDLDDTDRRASV